MYHWLKRNCFFKACFLLRIRSTFPFSFRVTLFKLFVMPHFDYCSSVFFFSVSKSTSSQFVKSFHRILRSTLSLNISSRLDLSSQTSTLKSLGLLPIKLRLFKRLCSLIFKSFRTGRARSFLTRYERFIRIRALRET